MTRLLVTLLSLTLLLATPLGAQEKPTLSEYTWKSRVQVSINGEVKSLRIYEVFLDSTGCPQKVEIDNQDPQAHAPKAPLRRAISHRAGERKKADLEEIQKAVAPYSVLSAEAIQKFMAGAQVTPLPQSAPPALQFHGKGLASPEDEVTLVVTERERRPLRMTVRTSCEGDPVTLEMTYGQLACGLPYLEHTVTRAPEQKIEMDVLNFDYRNK